MDNFFSRGICVQNIEFVLAIFNNNLAIYGVICLHPTRAALLRYYHVTMQLNANKNSLIKLCAMIPAFLSQSPHILVFEVQWLVQNALLNAAILLDRQNIEEVLHSFHGRRFDLTHHKCEGRE